MTLLGETADQVGAAQRELARIGIDRPAAIATGKPEDWAAGEPLASFPVADFAALAEARRSRRVTVLDVRRDLEWAAGHLDGAVHIPLHELTGRLGEIPGGEPGAGVGGAGRAVNCGCTARRATARRWPRPCCRRPAVR